MSNLALSSAQVQQFGDKYGNNVPVSYL